MNLSCYTILVEIVLVHIRLSLIYRNVVACISGLSVRSFNMNLLTEASTSAFFSILVSILLNFEISCNNHLLYLNAEDSITFDIAAQAKQYANLSLFVQFVSFHLEHGYTNEFQTLSSAAVSFEPIKLHMVFNPSRISLLQTFLEDSQGHFPPLLLANSSPNMLPWFTTFMTLSMKFFFKKRHFPVTHPKNLKFSF